MLNGQLLWLRVYCLFVLFRSLLLASVEELKPEQCVSKFMLGVTALAYRSKPCSNHSSKTIQRFVDTHSNIG